jgi:hypothetical protein
MSGGQNLKLLKWWSVLQSFLRAVQSGGFVLTCTAKYHAAQPLNVSIDISREKAQAFKNWIQ